MGARETPSLENGYEPRFEAMCGALDSVREHFLYSTEQERAAAHPPWSSAASAAEEAAHAPRAQNAGGGQRYKSAHFESPSAARSPMKRIPLPPVPNGWYKALYSDALEVGDVKPLSILDQEFVAYRGEDGQVRLMDGYCPHLGAHLAHGGKVKGNALICPFHNWTWDGSTGSCLDVPYSEQIPPRARTRTYPTREQNGYVMFWFHSEQAPPTFDIDVIPETADPSYRLYKRVDWQIRSHIQEVYENVVDVAHFRSLHQMDVQSVSWEPVGASDAPTVKLHINLVRESEEQSGADGGTEIESYMYGPGLQVTRLSGKMKGVSVNSLTPLGDEKLEVGHAYYVERSDPASEKEVESFWDYYMDDHALDFNIWNNKRYLENPVLAKGDGDVASFRRWFKQFYPASNATTAEHAAGPVKEHHRHE